MTDSFQGKRQRASSEGNVLEKDEPDEGDKPERLTEEHRKVSKSLHLTGAKPLQPVEVIADDQKYLTLPNKSKRRGRPSFKSVKNFMNKIKGPSAGTNLKSNTGNGGPKGGWTPTLQRKDNSQDRGKYSNQTDSTSRPLITTDDQLPKWGGRTPGTVGIQNHGNTCFMNAVLQCLSNTDWFSKYFITKQYKDDLKGKNFSKKFNGTKCDVTEQLGLLLESLWSLKYDNNISNAFKHAVGKSNAQYKGTEQHDSQEFLLWLLDRINEDLAIKKKEKIVKTKNTLSDDEAAIEVLALNSGCVLHNMFQAVYRSSLKCPHCQKLSNTFETYLCLSLSLPYRTTRPVYVTVVYCNGDPRQEKVGLTLNVYDTVRELREEVSKFADTPENRLVLCQVTEDGFRNTFGDDQPLTDIHENETVYAIEMLPSPVSHIQDQTNPDQGMSDEEFEASFIQIILVHIEKKTSNRYSRFCLPLVLKVLREIDYKGLQKEILKAMGDTIREGLIHQKLDILFHLRIVDGCPGRSYLPEDPDIMPFYTQTVESALSVYNSDYGPQHLKLVAEWDLAKMDKVIRYNDNEIMEHPSVKKVRQSQIQPFKVSLDQCIQTFTKEETLSGADAWSCSHCGKQQQGATKSLGLWSLPDVLVIHLKRFRQTGLRRTKLSTLIDFPIDGLDMSNHMIKRTECDVESETDMTYDLFGVCNHYGNMLGGHYTASCRNPLDQRWYEFDDSKVKPMSAAEVKTSSAYLLFYQRRGVKESIVEDVISGSHWIYKIFPYKHNPPQVAQTEGVCNQQVTEKKQICRNELTHDSHIERQTDYDDFVSQNIRHDDVHDNKHTVPQMTHSQLRNGHSENSHEVLSRASHESRKDVLDGCRVSGRASPNHLDLERSSLYDRPANSTGKTDVHQSFKVNGARRSDSKLTDRTRDLSAKNEIKSSYRSGLKVKLPDNEAFIVRQNNLTGKTLIQRYEFNEDLRLNSRSNGQGQNLFGGEKGFSAIKMTNNDIPLSGKVEQGVPRVSDPQMYADNEDVVDSGHDPTSTDPRSSLRGDHSFSNRKESKGVPCPVNQQSGRQVLPTSSFTAKMGWSTPQQQRKQSPPPVSLLRQLSHPTKSGYHSESARNTEPINHGAKSFKSEELKSALPPGQSSTGTERSEAVNGLPPRPQNVNHKRSKSQPRSSESDQYRYDEKSAAPVRNRPNGYNEVLQTAKFATIARVNRKHIPEDFRSSKEQALPRSITENSIREPEIKNIHEPVLLEARSRKPVYDAVIQGETSSYTEGFPRYYHNRHITKQFQNKDQAKFFHKEKMFSPCPKESSV